MSAESHQTLAVAGSVREIRRRTVGGDVDEDGVLVGAQRVHDLGAELQDLMTPHANRRGTVTTAPRRHGRLPLPLKATVPRTVEPSSVHSLAALQGMVGEPLYNDDQVTWCRIQSSQIVLHIKDLVPHTKLSNCKDLVPHTKLSNCAPYQGLGAAYKAIKAVAPHLSEHVPGAAGEAAPVGEDDEGEVLAAVEVLDRLRSLERRVGVPHLDNKTSTRVSINNVITIVVTAIIIISSSSCSSSSSSSASSPPPASPSLSTFSFSSSCSS
jgi:hypothetical protein